jgi:polar amino acid transport system substrate-binding protein
MLFVAALITACQPEAVETAQPPTLTPIAATPTRAAAVVDAAMTPTVPAVSESALTRIREQGTLRVGILYNYPPFGYLTHDGSVQGYEAELARRIAERWGVEVMFVQVTRQTRLPMLLDGSIDVIAGAMPHRRELEQFVEFSDTTFRSGYTVLVSNTSGLESLRQIDGIPIVVVGREAQTIYSDYVTRTGIAANAQLVQSTDEAAALLTNGAAQAIVGRREDLILATTTLQEVRILDEFLLIEPYAFAVQRGDTPLRDLINLTLQTMISENVLGEVFSANFFGYAPDPYPAMSGDPVFTFESMPAGIPPGESALERFRRGEPLRVAGMNLTGEPPLFDGQLIVDGYNRAVINEIARRWNVPVVELPDSAGPAGVAKLQASEADVVVGVRPEKPLIGVAALSLPYYTRGIRLLHMDDVTVNGVGDLEYKPSLAAPPLDVSQDLIEDNNGAPQIRTTESFEEALEILTNRGVNAVVGDEFALALMAQADERIEVDERLYRPMGYVIASSPYDTELLALINFTFQDMFADGTLARLQDQYIKPYSIESEEPILFEMELWPGNGGFLGFGQ